MPRPLSWLPRLHEIRRSVQNSVRSHYDRRDLQTLFELQPRAAQKLLELLPTVPIGTAKLVEREELATFLDRVGEAEDTSRLMEEIRQERAAPSRKKIRSLVRRDAEPVSFSSLPESIGLSRGRLEVSFRTVVELAEAMYAIARLLEDEGDAFAEAFEVEPSPPDPEDAGEVQAMFAELEQMEANRAATR